MPELFDGRFNVMENSPAARAKEVPIVWAKRVYLELSKVELYLSITLSDKIPYAPGHRGPKLTIGNKIKAEMERMDPAVLRSMTHDAMRAKFKRFRARPDSDGPSAKTCSRHRNRRQLERAPRKAAVVGGGPVSVPAMGNGSLAMSSMPAASHMQYAHALAPGAESTAAGAGQNKAGLFIEE